LFWPYYGFADKHSLFLVFHDRSLEKGWAKTSC
jgi:hypothetical protein